MERVEYLKKYICSKKVKNTSDSSKKSLNFKKTVIFCLESAIIPLWMKGEWIIWNPIKQK